MPQKLPREAVDQAEAAITYAKQVRRFHRRRRTVSPTRQEELKLARDRLAEAMAPLRSEIGRFPYGPNTTVAERNRELIRETSQAIQVERRKLTKMMHTKSAKQAQ